MIMHEKPNDVIVKGLGETSEFTIKTSAKAFKILSQNLYSNPVGAVVRELSTNAYDSHVMAGCPERPFKITVPSSLNPEFSIRDYGTGLSHEDVIGLYSTFFESTKTQSNDMVGCLGLGSKSPFALTDSFFVISYFNGIKSVYSVFTDKNFIPSISLFGSEETEEENGLEIQIAVKNNQIKDFPYEIKKQLHFFKTKPIVEGYPNFYFNSFEVKMTGDGWYYSPDFNTSYVVQGQIAYPLDRYLLRSVGDIDSKLINTSKIVERGYAFELPIGSVDIAPSREALSYDEDTIKAIVDKAGVIVSNIEEKIIDSINNAKDIWEAINIRYDLQNAGFLTYSPVFPVMKFDVSSSLINFDVETKKYHTKSARTVANTSCKNSDGSYYVNVRDNALFVRVKSTEHKNHDFKVRQLVLDKRSPVYVLYSDLSIKTLQKKLKKKDLEILEVSELDYKRQPKFATVKKEKTECKKLSNSSFCKSAAWYNSDTSQMDSESFYVEISRYDYIVNGRTHSPEGLVDAVRFLKEMNVLPLSATIYGLNKKQAMVTTAKNLINYVLDYFKTKTLYNIPEHPVCNISHELLGDLSIAKKVKYLAELKQQNRLLQDYRMDRIRFWGVEFNKEDISDDVEDLNKYNLLTHVSSSKIPEVIKMMEFCESNGYYKES